jgi:hypothetical protein
VTVSDVANRHYRNAKRIRRSALREVRRAWAQLNPARPDESWYEQVGPQLIAVVALAQLASAEESDGYVSSVLREFAGSDAPQPAGTLNPDAFAGEAADGRPLESLLHQPVRDLKRGTASGLGLRKAKLLGRTSLELITSTEVADAGRVADGVAVASRPRVAGYVRMLTPPSCARCAVLAGRFYRWNDWFERHPNCDCRHIPVDEDTADSMLTDPRAAVLNNQVTGLSKADRRAIEDGADVGQVVNAHRGMYAAGGRKFTTEGTSRRGFARQRLGRGVPRLRPEQIYKEANGNREEAIRLLHLHGYLI